MHASQKYQNFSESAVAIFSLALLLLDPKRFMASTMLISSLVFLKTPGLSPNHSALTVRSRSRSSLCLVQNFPWVRSQDLYVFQGEALNLKLFPIAGLTVIAIVEESPLWHMNPEVIVWRKWPVTNNSFFSPRAQMGNFFLLSLELCLQKLQRRHCQRTPYPPTKMSVLVNMVWLTMVYNKWLEGARTSENTDIELQMKIIWDLFWM